MAEAKVQKLINFDPDVASIIETASDGNFTATLHTIVREWYATVFNPAPTQEPITENE